MIYMRANRPTCMSPQRVGSKRAYFHCRMYDIEVRICKIINCQLRQECDINSVVAQEVADSMKSASYLKKRQSFLSDTS